MARMVATKAALSIRIDALSDADSRSEASAAEVGVTNRVKLESRLRALEHRAGIQSVRRVTTGAARPTPRWEMNGAAKDSGYNNANDSVKLENGMESVREMLPTQPASAVEAAVKAVTEVKDEKRKEKEERRAAKKEKRKSVGPVVDPADVSMDVDGDDKPGETKEEKKARKEAKKAVS